MIGTSLSNIYFKKRFDNLKFNFSNFQQLKNRYAMCTLCWVFLIVMMVGPISKISQVGSSIFNNFDKYKYFFLFYHLFELDLS